MERNFLLALALSFLVLTLWSIYTGEARREQLEAERATPEASTPAPPTAPAAPGGPPAAAPGSLPWTEGRPSPAAPLASAGEAKEVVVTTDLYRAVVSTRGAGLVSWTLREYDDASHDGRPPVELVTPDPSRPVALTTPLEGLGLGDLSLAPWTLEREEPRRLDFVLERQGVRVRKSYEFGDGDYQFRLRTEVVNDGDRSVRPTFHTVWPAARQDTPDYQELSLVARIDGSLEQAPIAGAGGFLGIGGGLDEQLEYPSEVDWGGSQTRYFLAALLPDVPRDAALRFTPVDADRGLTEIAFRPVEVPPGQRATREFRIYLGPKEPERLEAIGGHLDEAIPKGWFGTLADFFIWALNATYAVVPNYGIAIIVITILMRIVMWPIMGRQMRSMKKMSEQMRVVQPKVKEIQEKYADDRQRMNEEMMKVYRESGVNPFGMASGCLPMFLQLPVFIGLFYALQSAIELRQAPFFGWIDDLSAPETLFVIPGLELPVRLLPLLMGGSMVLQQRLTPTAMDPAQARMMNTVMPVMFTFLFYQFASGLVLYWFVSNVLGMLQQLYTNRQQR